MTAIGPTLLESVFTALDLGNGQLLRPSETPTANLTSEEWRSAGEWLMLARRMNAERVFFVDNNPVVVFAELSDPHDDEELIKICRQAWSMARPRCLFVSSPEELRVYSLSVPPVESIDRVAELRPVQVVSATADVADRLSSYHRERIEDGSLFEQIEYRTELNRADSQFLHDVRVATEILSQQGLAQRIAHGLIERVVLIRYLEDRRVLLPQYFDQVAERSKSWLNILNTGRSTVLGSSSSFLACLDDIDLTAAIFDQLALGFNGDLFVVSDEEAESITSSHLTIATLRRRLFTVPGRLVRTARRLHLRLPRNWPWATAFLTALDSIQALPMRC